MCVLQDMFKLQVMLIQLLQETIKHGEIGGMDWSDGEESKPLCSAYI